MVPRLGENDRIKLETVLMEVFKRYLGISRSDRVRNEQVKRRISIENQWKSRKNI